jgi:hypothetical protein
MERVILVLGEIALVLGRRHLCGGLRPADRVHGAGHHPQTAGVHETVSRQQELAEDVQRLTNFLSVLVGEAAQLQLPLPKNVTECLTALTTWSRQLRESDAR